MHKIWLPCGGFHIFADTVIFLLKWRYFQLGKYGTSHCNGQNKIQRIPSPICSALDWTKCLVLKQWLWQMVCSPKLQVTAGYYKYTYQTDKWLQIKQFNSSYCLTIYRGCSFKEYLVRSDIFGMIFFQGFSSVNYNCIHDV